jgi:predicted DNA-binding transcriptional regulator AlpA
LTSSRRHHHRRVAEETRWLRNVDLAEYLGVSIMCIWRWQHDPELGFPRPARVNGISYTDRNGVDAWMRGRVADLANERTKRASK